MRVSTNLALLAGCLAITVVACGDDEPQAVSVFAASSLTDVMGEVAGLYEAEYGVSVEVSVGASSALREQILDGAPADVFVSASPTIVAELTQVGAIVEPIEAVATTDLVLLVAEGNPLSLSASSLADDDLLIGACDVEVPCGALAERVLGNANLWADGRIDTYEPSARALLAKMELGELDAAFGYRTDALTSEDVDFVTLPSTDGNQAVYIAGANAPGSLEATSFIEFLSGEPAQQVFRAAGFGP